MDMTCRVLRLFEIPVDYKLDLSQHKINLDLNDLQRYWFFDEKGLIKPIYMNTTVIPNMEALKSIIKNNKTVFILSEEAIRGKNLF